MQNSPAHGELRNEMGKLILGGHFHFYDYKDSRQPRPHTHRGPRYLWNRIFNRFPTS
jgi:hypothetical protein